MERERGGERGRERDHKWIDEGIGRELIKSLFQAPSSKVSSFASSLAAALAMVEPFNLTFGDVDVSGAEEEGRQALYAFIDPPSRQAYAPSLFISSPSSRMKNSKDSHFLAVKRQNADQIQYLTTREKARE